MRHSAWRWCARARGPSQHLARFGADPRKGASAAPNTRDDGAGASAAIRARALGGLG